MPDPTPPVLSREEIERLREEWRVAPPWRSLEDDPPEVTVPASQILITGPIGDGRWAGRGGYVLSLFWHGRQDLLHRRPWETIASKDSPATHWLPMPDPWLMPAPDSAKAFNCCRSAWPNPDCFYQARDGKICARCAWDAQPTEPHALDEPTRIEAARAAGYREGIEEAARWHDKIADAHAAVVRALGPEDELARISSMGERDHRTYARMIRALIPAPPAPEAPAPITEPTHDR